VLAHYGHGLLALQDGDVDEAERHLGLAHDGFAALRTPVWEGWALVTQGRCHELRGDDLAARELFGAAHEMGTRSGVDGKTPDTNTKMARTKSAEETKNRSGTLEREAADVRRRLGRPRPHYQDTWQSGERLAT
jgi:hypothetical protein